MFKIQKNQSGYEIFDITYNSVILTSNISFFYEWFRFVNLHYFAKRKCDWWSSGKHNILLLFTNLKIQIGKQFVGNKELHIACNACCQAMIIKRWCQRTVSWMWLHWAFSSSLFLVAVYRGMTCGSRDGKVGTNLILPTIQLIPYMPTL